jgi:AbrB family looped-hinge helix DNA binding protein
MASSTDEPRVVRVSHKGQATIPKSLREKFGIETPGEVFIYEEGGRIVIEPVPSIDDLHGIHAGDREPGVVLERVREEKADERRSEAERVDRLQPSAAGDEEADGDREGAGDEGDQEDGAGEDAEKEETNQDRDA